MKIKTKFYFLLLFSFAILASCSSKKNELEKQLSKTEASAKETLRLLTKLDSVFPRRWRYNNFDENGDTIHTAIVWSENFLFLHHTYGGSRGKILIRKKDNIEQASIEILAGEFDSHGNTKTSVS